LGSERNPAEPDFKVAPFTKEHPMRARRTLVLVIYDFIDMSE